MRAGFTLTAISLALAVVSVESALARTGDSIANAEEKSLVEALAERTPGKPAQCIDQRQMTGPESFGDRTIVYRQSRRRIWVSKLREGCPWLRGDRTLVVESFGTQICQNDHFRVLPRSSAIASGSCFFGVFTPYDRVAKR